MQGFNMGRYVPPDQEGVTSANKLAGKHPLGARARHLNTTGALIVRFEMPFTIWCTTCKPNETPIGQGVRFNAEKKKVGNYHSTPIWSFRMKHTACDGWIEIRTDPKNTAYVVTEGARKRDTGENKELQPGEILIGSGIREQDPAEKDPFAKIESKVEDKQRASTEASRILELQKLRDRDWEDPYEMSKRLRRTFRTERHGLEKAAANREALQDKMSLGFDLVDETEEDRQHAEMIDFGDDHSVMDTEAKRAARIKPMFEKRASATPSDKPAQRVFTTRREREIARRKEAWCQGVAANTRAAMDPFLAYADDPDFWKLNGEKGTKRKRPPGTTLIPKRSPRETPVDDPSHSSVPDVGSISPEVKPEDASNKKSTKATPEKLVDYSSDSE
ncbi:hypothetical protein N7532_008503 [Penicillium argentinense]|uniref:DUF455 domain protein n=1 Tax=Penicillium argentinense TaxID=1131581 RepID=A0A9W9K1P0_9EURO|nr:uncharacterized protein N7532_008503 [Penicillium argentinense]KAJ5089819.1 hypothetical protein N7532_008503 [Penicillium argentinense]